jgi:hypothetical protein
MMPTKTSAGPNEVVRLGAWGFASRTALGILDNISSADVGLGLGEHVGDKEVPRPDGPSSPMQ